MELLNVDEVKALLVGHKRCLIGVSGGLDSMALVTWINQHKSQFPVEFHVMYVDHGIHEQSANWGEFVTTYCKQIGMPCTVQKVSLDGLGNNLEYAARRARYKAFCDFEFESLIIAHHINDQCENFLLKLFRGSGVKGLSAMPKSCECWYNSNVTLIRPMLSVTRSQIENWAEENCVPNIVDSSNLDNRYDRNYIRNKIWPIVQDRFDIADINAVRSIAHISEAWELVTELADMDIQKTSISDGVLDWEKLKSLSYIRIKNVILRILGKENIYNFSINHVEQFSQGLKDANMDSRNELSLKGFSIRKIGKRINVSINPRTTL